MLEDYNKTPVKEFRGLYRRGTPEEVPRDHFVDSQNLSFEPGSFEIRPGSSLFIDFETSINEIAEWVPSKGTQPYPVLGIDNDGNFYLWTPTGVLNIYFVPGATSFVAVNYFGRLFICPTNSSGPVGNLLMMYYNEVDNLVFRECGMDSPVALTPMTSTVNVAGGQTGSTTGLASIVNQSGNLNGWFELINLLTGNDTTVTLFGTSVLVNQSNLLQITGFDFSSIPDTADILGITVNISEYQIDGTSAVFNSAISLLGIASVSKSSLTPLSSTPTVAIFGGAADKWGNTSIIGYDVKSPQFGVQIQLECTLLPGNGANAAIDGISVEIAWQTSAGSIDVGTYNIGVVYQTDTGFLTPPATSPNLNITATVTVANSSITLNNIPTSDSPYVYKRLIIVAMQDSLGDIGEYFFVPAKDGGVIDDNISTTTTLSFFLTDLVESADYLFNVRARIPAGQNINVYSARLVLLGFPQPDASTLRLSNKANPETFDQTKESIVVNKDDGYFASNTAVMNSILYIWKFKGIWATIDNDSDPVSWDVRNIDDALGCGFRGLSTVSPTVSKGTTSGLILFIDISGVYLFNGYVIRPPLTWKIQDLWDTITDISNLSIVIDTENDRFLISNA